MFAEIHLISAAKWFYKITRIRAWVIACVIYGKRNDLMTICGKCVGHVEHISFWPTGYEIAVVGNKDAHSSTFFRVTNT
jgi:hypothetical protein